MGREFFFGYSGESKRRVLELRAVHPAAATVVEAVHAELPGQVRTLTYHRKIQALPPSSEDELPLKLGLRWAEFLPPKPNRPSHDGRPFRVGGLPQRAGTHQCSYKRNMDIIYRDGSEALGTTRADLPRGA